MVIFQLSTTYFLIKPTASYLSRITTTGAGCTFLLFFLFACSHVSANPAITELSRFYCGTGNATTFHDGSVSNQQVLFLVDDKAKQLDTLPKTIDVTVVVPFEYKQSSLNFASTFRIMDSVAEVLLDNDSITFSIDGYSYLDEGNDNICYWLSYNRALAVKTYVLGRGIDSARLLRFVGKSKARSILRKNKKEPVDFNCTAEIELNFPIPPPPVVILDRDEDGIADDIDNCPEEYGYPLLNGCPNKNAIIAPFEPGLSALYAGTYKVLDSVVNILRNDPTLKLAIEGHAYKEEGVQMLCEQLARERADIVKRYLLTRRIARSRIEEIKSFSDSRPINAGRNPWEKARNSRAELYILQRQ
ncbi:MAG: OmpA family protein [Ferruginibacter sp.]|nr:OmpA family protein [Ferruginibacter sp.]